MYSRYVDSPNIETSICSLHCGLSILHPFSSQHQALSLLGHLSDDAPGDPEDDLHQAEDGEAAEESQRPAHVGDEIEHSHGGGADDDLGSLVHHAQVDQVDAVVALRTMSRA